MRTFMRRAWKSVQLLHDCVSPKPPRPGIHVSISYLRAAASPRSPAAMFTTR